MTTVSIGGRLFEWKPELHPRDKRGRFRNGWKIPGKAAGILDRMLRTMRPAEWGSDAEARTSLDRSLKKQRPRTPKQEAALKLFFTREQNWHTQDALRRPDAMPIGPVTSGNIKNLGDAMRPTDQDLILTHVSGFSPFGVTSATPDEVDEWTGKLVSDAGFFATSAQYMQAPANPGDPPHITWSILAPAGTRAVIRGNGSDSVILDRDQPIQIIKVSDDGYGGKYIHAAVMPRQGAGPTQGLHTALQEHEKSPAIEATPEEMAKRGLNPDGTPMEGAGPAPTGIPQGEQPALGPVKPGEQAVGPPSAETPTQALQAEGKTEAPLGAGHVVTAAEAGGKPKITREQRGGKQVIPEEQAQAAAKEKELKAREDAVRAQEQRVQEAQQRLADQQAKTIEQQQKLIDSQQAQIEQQPTARGPRIHPLGADRYDRSLDQPLPQYTPEEQRRRDEAVVRAAQRIQERGGPVNSEEDRIVAHADAIRRGEPAPAAPEAPAPEAPAKAAKKAAKKVAAPGAAERAAQAEQAVSTEEKRIAEGKPRARAAKKTAPTPEAQAPETQAPERPVSVKKAAAKKVAIPEAAPKEEAPKIPPAPEGEKPEARILRENPGRAERDRAIKSLSDREKNDIVKRDEEGGHPNTPEEMLVRSTADIIRRDRERNGLNPQTGAAEGGGHEAPTPPERPEKPQITREKPAAPEAPKAEEKAAPTSAVDRLLEMPTVRERQDAYDELSDKDKDEILQRAETATSSSSRDKYIQSLANKVRRERGQETPQERLERRTKERSNVISLPEERAKPERTVTRNPQTGRLESRSTGPGRSPAPSETDKEKEKKLAEARKRVEAAAKKAEAKKALPRNIQREDRLKEVPDLRSPHSEHDIAPLRKARADARAGVPTTKIKQDLEDHIYDLDQRESSRDNTPYEKELLQEARDRYQQAIKALTRRTKRAPGTGRGPTVADLRKEAADLKVPGRSKMTKDELIKAIEPRRRREGESEADHLKRITGEKPTITRFGKPVAAAEEKVGAGSDVHEGMLARQLRDVADAEGIKLPSRATKKDIVKAIQDAREAKAGSVVPETKTPLGEVIHPDEIKQALHEAHQRDLLQAKLDAHAEKQGDRKSKNLAQGYRKGYMTDAEAEQLLANDLAAAGRGPGQPMRAPGVGAPKLEPTHRKGVHQIRLPDGTMAERTSKTRDYTHAVMTDQNNHVLADHIEERSKAQQEALAAYHDALRTGDWSKFERVPGSGNMQHTSYDMRYKTPFARTAGGYDDYGFRFPSGLDKDLESERKEDARMHAYFEESRKKRGETEPYRSWLEEKHPEAAKALAEGDFNGYRKYLTESSTRSVGDSRAKDAERIKELRAGPEHTYYISRWSTGHGHALSATKSRDIPHGRGYKNSVVEVGDDLSGGKESGLRSTGIGRHARAVEAAPEAKAIPQEKRDALHQHRVAIIHQFREDHVKDEGDRKWFARQMEDVGTGTAPGVTKRHIKEHADILRHAAEQNRKFADRWDSDPEFRKRMNPDFTAAVARKDAAEQDKEAERFEGYHKEFEKLDFREKPVVKKAAPAKKIAVPEAAPAAKKAAPAAVFGGHPLLDMLPESEKQKLAPHIEDSHRRSVAITEMANRLVPSLSGLDNFIERGGSEQGLRFHVRGLRKRGVPEEDLKPMEEAIDTGDKEKMRAAIRALEKRLGLERIGASDEEVPFDLEKHESGELPPEMRRALREGKSKAYLLAPGYKVNIDGKSHLVRRAPVVTAPEGEYRAPTKESLAAKEAAKAASTTPRSIDEHVAHLKGMHDEDAIEKYLNDSKLTIPQMKEVAAKVAPDLPIRGRMSRPMLAKTIAASHPNVLEKRPATVFREKPTVRRAAFNPQETVDKLKGAKSEEEAIKHLASDTQLTAPRLRQVAEGLGIPVPDGMRAKTAIQLHIAEKLAEKNGLKKVEPTGLPEVSEKLTIPRLREIAEKENIKLPSRVLKRDIVKMIQDHRAGKKPEVAKPAVTSAAKKAAKKATPEVATEVETKSPEGKVIGAKARRGDLVVVETTSSTSYQGGRPTEHKKNFEVGRVTSVTRDGKVAEYETARGGRVKTSRNPTGTRYHLSPKENIDVDAAMETARNNPWPNGDHKGKPYDSLAEVRDALKPHRTGAREKLEVSHEPIASEAPPLEERKGPAMLLAEARQHTAIDAAKRHQFEGPEGKKAASILQRLRDKQLSPSLARKEAEAEEARLHGLQTKAIDAKDGKKADHLGEMAGRYRKLADDLGESQSTIKLDEYRSGRRIPQPSRPSIAGPEPRLSPAGNLVKFRRDVIQGREIDLKDLDNKELADLDHQLKAVADRKNPNDPAVQEAVTKELEARKGPGAIRKALAEGRLTPAKKAQVPAAAERVNNPPELGGEGPHGPAAWLARMRNAPSEGSIASNPDDIKHGQFIHDSSSGWGRIVGGPERDRLRREDVYRVVFPNDMGGPGQYSHKVSVATVRARIKEHNDLKRYADMRTAAGARNGGWLPGHGPNVAPPLGEQEAARAVKAAGRVSRATTTQEKERRAKEWGHANGYEGRTGGWIHDKNGKAVAHGWISLYNKNGPQIEAHHAEKPAVAKKAVEAAKPEVPKQIPLTRLRKEAGEGDHPIVGRHRMGRDELEKALADRKAGKLAPAKKAVKKVAPEAPKDTRTPQQKAAETRARKDAERQAAYTRDLMKSLDEEQAQTRKRNEERRAEMTPEQRAAEDKFHEEMQARQRQRREETLAFNDQRRIISRDDKVNHDNLRQALVDAHGPEARARVLEQVDRHFRNKNAQFKTPMSVWRSIARGLGIKGLDRSNNDEIKKRILDGFVDVDAARREDIAARKAVTKDRLHEPEAIRRVIGAARNDHHRIAMGRMEDEPISDRGGDLLGEHLAAEQGFDRLPQVVDHAQFERRKKDMGLVLYRGVNTTGRAEPGMGGEFHGKPASEVHDEFREGRYHMGIGSFGNGTYMTKNSQHAKGYSDLTPGSIARYGLTKDAKIVELPDLHREYDEYMKEHPEGTPEHELYSDLGRFAMGRGYDAIHVPRGSQALGTGPEGAKDQYVILNRGKVIAEAPEGEHIPGFRAAKKAVPSAPKAETETQRARRELAELRLKARERNIRGRSTMDADQLRQAVEAHDKGQLPAIRKRVSAPRKGSTIGQVERGPTQFEEATGRAPRVEQPKGDFADREYRGSVVHGGEALPEDFRSKAADIREGKYAQRPGLSEDESKALDQYVLSRVADPLNKSLREGKTSDLGKAEIANHEVDLDTVRRDLDSAIQHSELREDTQLYRGALMRPADIAKLQKGAITREDGYLSTTTDSRHAHGIIGWRQRKEDTPAGLTPVMFKILAPKGTHAAAGHISEREVLLGRGRQMRVVDVLTGRGFPRVVTLELLPEEHKGTEPGRPSRPIGGTPIGGRPIGGLPLGRRRPQTLEELKPFDMTREEFDKLPEDRQKSILDTLREVKNSGDTRTIPSHRTSMGTTIRGATAPHVHKAGVLYSRYTHVPQPPEDRSAKKAIADMERIATAPEGRHGDKDIGLHLVLSRRSKNELRDIATEGRLPFGEHVTLDKNRERMVKAMLERHGVKKPLTYDEKKKAARLWGAKHGFKGDSTGFIMKDGEHTGIQGWDKIYDKYKDDIEADRAPKPEAPRPPDIHRKNITLTELKKIAKDEGVTPEQEKLAGRTKDGWRTMIIANRAEKELPERPKITHAEKAAGEKAVAAERAGRIPSFTMPAGTDEKKVQELRDALKQEFPESYTVRESRNKVDFDGPDRIKAITKGMDRPTVDRIAREADHDNAFRRFIQMQRTEEPTDPYADLPPITDAEYKKASERAVRTLREEFSGDKPIVVRTEGEHLGSILDGGLKNAFQTGRSGSLGGSTKRYKDLRREQEAALFGIPHDAPGEDRPIYGSVGVDGIHPAKEFDRHNQYGDVQVVLRPDVRHRTTISEGDTLDDDVLPSPMDDPQLRSFNGSVRGFHETGEAAWNPVDWSKRYTRPEAQIHGGVRPEDIDSVIFHSEPSPEIKRKLDEKGIPYHVLGDDAGPIKPGDIKRRSKGEGPTAPKAAEAAPSADRTRGSGLPKMTPQYRRDYEQGYRAQRSGRSVPQGESDAFRDGHSDAANERDKWDTPWAHEKGIPVDKLESSPGVPAAKPRITRAPAVAPDHKAIADEITAAPSVGEAEQALSKAKTKDDLMKVADHLGVETRPRDTKETIKNAIIRQGATRRLEHEGYQRRVTHVSGTTSAAAPEGEHGLSADQTVREGQVEDRIRAAYQDVAGDKGGFVRIADVRERIGDNVPRAEVDAALKRMERSRAASLAPQDYGSQRTAADTAAAVAYGGRDNHLIRISTKDNVRGPGAPKSATPEYRRDYERGWRASSSGKSLEDADMRGVNDAWYDGYHDHAAGREKWDLPWANEKGIQPEELEGPPAKVHAPQSHAASNLRIKHAMENKGKAGHPNLIHRPYEKLTDADIQRLTPEQRKHITDDLRARQEAARDLPTKRKLLDLMHRVQGGRPGTTEAPKTPATKAVRKAVKAAERTPPQRTEPQVPHLHEAPPETAVQRAQARLTARQVHNRVARAHGSADAAYDLYQLYDARRDGSAPDSYKKALGERLAVTKFEESASPRDVEAKGMRDLKQLMGNGEGLDNPDTMEEKLRASLKKLGVDVHGKPGDIVEYDPKTMHGFTPEVTQRLKPGDKVQIASPGMTHTDQDGKVRELKVMTVRTIPSGGSAPAEARVARIRPSTPEDPFGDVQLPPREMLAEHMVKHDPARDLLLNLKTVPGWGSDQHQLRASLQRMKTGDLHRVADRLGIQDHRQSKRADVLSKILRNVEERRGRTVPEGVTKREDLEKLTRAQLLERLGPGSKMPSHVQKAQIVESVLDQERGGTFHATEDPEIRAIHEAVGGGTTDVKSLGGGLTGQVSLVESKPTLEEKIAAKEAGKRAIEARATERATPKKFIRKRTFNDGFNRAEDQTDAETLVSRLMRGSGVDAPATYQAGRQTTYSEHVDGKLAERFTPEQIDEAVRSPAGRRIAIIDAITGQTDRHTNNWMIVKRDGKYEPVPIDNGLAFYHTHGGEGRFRPSYAHSHDRFAATYGYATGTRKNTGLGQMSNLDEQWAEHQPFSRQELQDVRKELVKMQPEFQHLGRQDWYDTALGRLDEMIKRSSSTPAPPTRPGFLTHTTGGRPTHIDTSPPKPGERFYRITDMLHADSPREGHPIHDVKIDTGGNVDYTIAHGTVYRRNGVTTVIEHDDTPTGRAYAKAALEKIERYQKRFQRDERSMQTGYALLKRGNPHDAMWAQKYGFDLASSPDTYEAGQFLSAATAAGGDVHIWHGQLKFIDSRILDHEFGHNADEVAPDHLKSSSPEWEKAAKSDSAGAAHRVYDFTQTHAVGEPIITSPVPGRPWPRGVTQYGTSSAGEDYGETVRLYRAGPIGTGRLYPGGPEVSIWFRDLFPARAAMMDQLFPTTARQQRAAIERLRHQAP